jgi:hypothetical protein
MEDIIVEGLQESDFILLEQILRNYSVSIGSSVSFQEITDLYIKINQIVKQLE